MYLRLVGVGGWWCIANPTNHVVDEASLEDFIVFVHVVIVIVMLLLCYYCCLVAIVVVC